MRRLAEVALIALALCAGAAARAETRVEVLATDPAGDPVALGANQSFYLRLGYSTDQATRIWVQPYFHGKEVPAGTSPSGSYTGSGEALGWFFLMHPGDEVDEVRINAGDGSRAGTHVVAAYPVHVIGGAQPAAASEPPAWVVELRRQSEAAAREAREQAARTPPTPGEDLFMTGFMLVVLALGVFGVAAPVWAIWRWSGAWRLAAALPVAMIAFVALRIVFDTSRDPTSHNLWPFEIVMSGALSVVAMFTLWVARKAWGRAVVR